MPRRKTVFSDEERAAHALELKKRKAERDKNRRENRTEQIRNDELQRLKNLRGNRSEEQRNADLVRLRRLRDHRSEEGRNKDLERKRILRANRSEEDRNADLERLRNLRANRSEEDRNKDLERLRNLRRNRSEEEVNEEKERNRISHAISRQRRRIQQSKCVALKGLTEFDEKQIINHHLGKLDQMCHSCGVINFDSERPGSKLFNVCCNQGSLKLPTIEINEAIKKIMTGEDTDSDTFFNHIRSYNSAFASIGANIKTPPGLGPFCYRIHGQMDHLSGTLHPQGEDNGKYAQPYIPDEDAADDERINEQAKAYRFGIMDKISRVNESRSFRTYKMMYGVEEEQRQLGPNSEG